MTLDALISALRAVLERQPDVRYAILFGSAVARGVAQARDIDVAISFKGRPSLIDEGRLANELEVAVGRTVDLVNLDEASTLLRREVSSTGRPIVITDRDAWLDFSARIALEWADLEPYFELESKGLRRAVLEEPSWSESTSSEPKSAG